MDAAITIKQERAWSGLALFSLGYRPFFLLGALWAALAMGLWAAMLAGQLALPTAFDPVSWHAHEFLFGYLAAIIAGFLLTAVPSWTGRPPLTGWPLASLAALWMAGRVAIMFSQGLPPLVVALVDLAMMAALAVLLTREIVAGGNWRNLPVVVLLVAFGAANGLFHWEAARGVYAAQGIGLRLGLAASLMMIAVIGGRIVPTFTRNWLVKRDEGRLCVRAAGRSGGCRGNSRAGDDRCRHLATCMDGWRAWVDDAGGHDARNAGTQRA